MTSLLQKKHEHLRVISKAACTALLIVLSSPAYYVSGQWRQKTADTYFLQMDYALSAKLYNELIHKYLKTSKIEQFEYYCIKQGAVASFKQLEMARASELFKMLEHTNQLNEKEWEMYLLALRNCGQYQHAQELAESCKKNYPDNPFFQRVCTCTMNPEASFISEGSYSIEPTGINSNKGEFAPSYSTDYLYFSSKKDRKSSAHPYYGWDGDYFITLQKVKRLGDSLIGTSEIVPGFQNKNGHDGPISFNSAEDLMVITRNNQTTGHLGLFYARKTNGNWTDLIPFPFNDDHFDVGQGSFAVGQNSIYFSSDCPGGLGEADLYVSEYKNDIWTQPKNLGKHINTDQNEFFPHVIDHTIYFSSNGHCGFGGLDLFQSDLIIQEQSKNLGHQINTMNDDFSLILSKDKTSGFFASNRGDGIDRIYHFRHKAPTIKLKGLVSYLSSNKISGNDHLIKINNLTTKETITCRSDSLGQFEIPLTSNSNYEIIASNAKGQQVLSTVKTTLPKTDTTYTCELKFPFSDVFVEISIVDRKTQKPIPFSTLSMGLTDYKQDTSLLSDRFGKIQFTGQPNSSHEINAFKKGYVDEPFSFVLPEDRDTMAFVIELTPIEKGTIFTIENIYYDLDKSTLREESKQSLDRLAAFILENNIQIELSSHTDSRGTTSYNNKLSQARAESCVTYLLSKGILHKDITAKGYGELKLVNQCTDNIECSEEDHQKNRRTEVKILSINE